MIKRTILILTAVLFVFGMTGTGFADTDKSGIDKENKIINVAGYDACTGKYGDYGLGDKWGQEIAVEEINAEGGIQAGPLKGYKLKLEFFDDRGDPKESANVAKKISASGYLAAFGGTISSCTLAAIPVYNRYGVADIVTYSNANTITSQGFNNVIRLTYTTRSIAIAMAENVKNKFKIKKVAIISENQDYGQLMRRTFKEKAGELGIEVVEDLLVTPGQDVDFKSVIMKAKSKKPGMVIIFVCYNEGGMLVNQARKLGWDVPMFGPDSLNEPKFFELAGKNSGEIYVLIGAEADADNPKFKYLARKWAEKHDGKKPSMSGIYGYDAVHVAKAVIEKGGVDRKSFIKYLRTVKVPGLMSSMYEFDERGEAKSALFKVATKEDLVK